MPVVLHVTENKLHVSIVLLDPALAPSKASGHDAWLWSASADAGRFHMYGASPGLKIDDGRTL
eukprot:4645214-Karenia_brevis.AAC.1